MVADLVHVVAGPESQVFEREFERVGPGPPERGTHHLQRHPTAPRIARPGVCRTRTLLASPGSPADPKSEDLGFGRGLEHEDMTGTPE